MKKIILSLFTISVVSLSASAQFPKLPKIEKPKLPVIDSGKTASDMQTSANTNNNAATTNNSAAGTSNNAVKSTLPSAAIYKPSLTVRAVRDLNYAKQPNVKNFWSWMPKVDFLVTGPIPDSSFFTVEFMMPNGTPWFSWDSEPMSVSEGSMKSVESVAVPRWSDKRSIIETGVFGFKITLKNGLDGTAKEMYSGKYKVSKKFAGTPAPDFKNQYAFYVEQDWALPIGYIGLDSKTNGDAPLLKVGMWFRGNYDNSRLAAYLYYNGKQISTTTSNEKGIGNSVKDVITEGDDEKQLYWAYWNFTFYNVLAFDNGTHPNAFLLKQNPGNYEIKVLLDGELVRTGGFTVGSDGKISDNGIAANNGFGGRDVVIPVKVIPAKEGALNLQAWKTDAFYGNPLTGFSAQ